jgi:riboflavin kinase/FMN adenylyltransferase
MIEISGKVIHGKKYGRVLGFPTANLDRRQYARKKLNVKLGIWAGNAQLQTKNSQLKTFPAAIVIGPIDKTGKPKIEAHLIDYKGNLYGKKITIRLKKFIRPFKKYKSVQDLKNQIGKDIIKINKIII